MKRGNKNGAVMTSNREQEGETMTDDGFNWDATTEDEFARNYVLLLTRGPCRTAAGRKVLADRYLALAMGEPDPYGEDDEDDDA
jgi:hypothetical protein